VAQLLLALAVQAETARAVVVVPGVTLVTVETDKTSTPDLLVLAEAVAEALGLPAQQAVAAVLGLGDKVLTVLVVHITPLSLLVGEVAQVVKMLPMVIQIPLIRVNPVSLAAGLGQQARYTFKVVMVQFASSGPEILVCSQALMSVHHKEMHHVC